MEYFATFGIMDFFDVFSVAFLLFYFYKLMKKSGSLNMFIGILTFIFVWMIVAQVLKMKMLGALFNKLVDVSVLALIVLFADEIRHFFRYLGTQTRTRRIFKWLTRRKDVEYHNSRWIPVVKACANISKRKEGALIVIEKKDEELKEIIKIGEIINSDINQLLIESIFFKNSPLHDGAMVISDNSIKAAASILPISESINVPKNFGLRHRAALGLTQKTEAVVIVVSEETGQISVFNKGNYHINLTHNALEQFLITYA